MQNIFCDVCKKKMDNPITNRTFFYYPTVGVCEPCKDNLEAQLKPQARNKEPFAFEWYQKLIKDTLDKGVQRGRI